MIDLAIPSDRLRRLGAQKGLQPTAPVTDQRGWILYGRLSVEESKNGTSLKNQVQIMMAWMTAQGHTVYRTIMDNGCSGKDLDRPGMRQLLAEVQAGNARGVVVAKLDRISRSLKDMLWLIELFNQHQVAFVCVRDPIETVTAAGKVFFQIRAAFAEFERSVISERQASSQELRRSKGQFTGGMVPRGFRSVGPKGGKRLEIDPLIGPQLALCWDKIRSGESVRDVVSYLTQARIPTRMGGPWTITSVWGLLHRKGYRGTLVDADTYDAAMRVLASRWSPTKAQREPEPTYDHRHENGVTERAWPLQGLARCAYCGCALVGTHGNGKGGRYYYLTCNGRQRKGSSTCEARNLPAAVWERAAIDAVAWLADRPELMVENLARYARERSSGLEPARQRRLELLPVLEKHQAERDRLVEALKAGAVVAQAIAPALEQVQIQLNSVTTILSDVEQQIAEGSLDESGIQALIPDLKAGLEALRSAPPAEQKSILHGLLAGIELGRDRDITLHVRVAGSGPNGGSPKTNFPPNRRGSEGSSSWCAREDSNLVAVAAPPPGRTPMGAAGRHDRASAASPEGK